MHEAGTFIAFPSVPLEQCDITAIELLNVAFTVEESGLQVGHITTLGPELAAVDGPMR